MPLVSPKMWKNGNGTSIVPLLKLLAAEGRNCSPSKGYDWRMLLTTLRWVRTTPLGLPVVPEEKGMVRMLSGSKLA